MKKQKMTKESIRILGLTQKLGKNFIYHHHVEPRSSIVRAEKIIISYSLSYIDVTRSTFADLEIAQEKQMYDYLDVDENRNLSDSWTSFTRFTLLNETLPKGFQQSGRGEEGWETDENSNDITSRSFLAWRIDKNWESSSKKKESRMSNRQTAIPCKRSYSWTCIRETVGPKIRRAKVSQVKLMCIDITGERRNSV